MIKYIASDLDGTLLLNGAQKLNPELFSLIRALKKKGVHFIAASGRQYNNMYRLFGPVQDDISYIAENGALCLHDNDVIFRGEIDRSLGQRIIDHSKGYPDCSCLLSCEKFCYTDSKDQKFIDHVRYTVGYDLEVVEDLHEIREPFLKIAMCDFHGTKDLEPYFKEKFQKEINVVTSGNIWIDFISPSANKGTTLSKLLKALCLTPADGIAFGDQYNDVEMLKLSGTSYALAGAAPGISDYTDHVTDSVEKTLTELLAQLN